MKTKIKSEIEKKTTRRNISKNNSEDKRTNKSN